jgi:hypothetical protein
MRPIQTGLSLMLVLALGLISPLQAVADDDRYVDGDLLVTGSLNVSGTKNFRIDHPLDPANRYLIHFASEGPEPFNVYAGNVVLDDTGQARIELPEWFEAINIDYRYQLTPLGAPAPDLHIAETVSGNAFLIGGGSAGQQVSWEIRARRNDRTMRRLDPVTEMDKPRHLRGVMLDPLAWEPVSGGQSPADQPAAR